MLSIKETAQHMIRLHGRERAAGWADEHELANIGENKERAEFWSEVAKEIRRVVKSSHVSKPHNTNEP